MTFAFAFVVHVTGGVYVCIFFSLLVVKDLTSDLMSVENILSVNGRRYFHANKE